MSEKLTSLFDQLFFCDLYEPSALFFCRLLYLLIFGVQRGLDWDDVLRWRTIELDRNGFLLINLKMNLSLHNLYDLAK